MTDQLISTESLKPIFPTISKQGFCDALCVSPGVVDGWDSDTDMECCAACGKIFYLELAADEDDYELEDH